MTSHRVLINQTTGEAREESLPGAKVHSSTDTPDEGVMVRSGLHGRKVQSAEGLKDTDLITVGDMELQVQHARDLGLLGKVFDQDLSSGAAAEAAQAAKEEAPAKAETKTETYGHEDFDAATGDLNAKLEDGSMEYSEAEGYHVALGQIALAEMSFEEVQETAQGLREGTVDLNELGSEKRALIEQVEKQVRDTATRSAVNEIGQEGVERIAQIAQTDPEFNAIVRQYGVLRAQGKADHTWSEFLAETEDWVAGNRS